MYLNEKKQRQKLEWCLGWTVLDSSSNHCILILSILVKRWIYFTTKMEVVLHLMAVDFLVTQRFQVNGV